MIVYCAADLFWATRIKATADAIGVSARPVRNRQTLEARLVESESGGPPVRGLVIDLETGEDGLTLIGVLRGHPNGKSARVVAFGPHVQEVAFARAKEAGAHAVLARGAFSNSLEQVLRELDAAP